MSIPRILLLFLFLNLQVGWVLAQAQLRVSLSDARVEVQSTIRISYQVEGGEATDFEFPKVPGLVAISGPSQMTSVQIVNGQVTREQRFSVDVIATRPGRYRIPPASVRVNGARIRSEGTEILVTPPANPSPQGALDADVVFRYLPSKTRVYVGERFRIDAELLNRVDVYTYRMLSTPSFGKLRVEQMKAFSNRAHTISIGGQTYQTQRLYVVDAYASQAGTYVVEPHTLNVNIVTAGGSGGSFFGPPTRAVNVTSAPISIEVLPLPTPLPADFSGAVGRWRFAGVFDGNPHTLNTNDALVFRLTAEGYGDVTRLDPPALDWPVGWRAYPTELAGETNFETDTGMVARREFVYTLLPEQAGTFTLAPQVSWFDVGTKRFEVFRADALAIRVTGAAGESSSTASASSEPGQVPGIFRGTPRVVHGYWVAEPWFWVLLLGVPLGLVIWQYRDRFVPTGRGQGVQQAIVADPLAEGRERLRQARVVLDDPSRFYDELARALDGYALDRLGLAASEQTPAQIRAAFAKTGATGEEQVLAKAYLFARELVYRGRFGGGIDREAREQALGELERVLSV